MTARALHSREDLLNVIRGRGRVTACNRAMDTGKIIVLGGFAPSQGIEVPSWQVIIESRHGKIWRLAAYDNGNRYGVREVACTQWEHWLGDERGEPGVYNGDHPMYFGQMKLITMENINAPTPEAD